MTYFSKKKKALYSRLKKHTDTMLVCDTCRKRYKLIFEYQALYCASGVVLDKDQKTQCIYSGYGSGYDTKKFVVNTSTQLKGKHICDNCIDDLLKNKMITEDETYDLWAAIDSYAKERIAEHVE